MKYFRLPLIFPVVIFYFSTVYLSSAFAVEVAENSGSFTIPWSISGDGICNSDTGCAARVFTVDGTARDGVDYEGVDVVISWNNGEGGERPVTVNLIDNDRKDGTREFVVNADPIRGLSSGGQVPIEIIDDEPPIAPGTLQFETTSISVSEVDGNATLSVQRVDGSDGRVSVSYATGAQGDTAEAGSDYSGRQGTLTWGDGDTSSKQISIPILTDTIRENDEQFTVILSGPGGDAQLGNQSSARVTIADSTANGTISFTQTSLSVLEGNSVQLSVQRQGGSDGEVTVQYQIGAPGNSAVAGEDYTVLSTSGELRWADGDTANKVITIDTLNDNQNEGEETLSVALSDPGGGAELGQNSNSTITIIEAIQEDFAPNLTILSGNEQSGFPGTVLDPFVISVQDGDAAAPGITVQWSVSPAGAGELVGGNSTTSNDAGQASNSLRILEGGIITVRAVVEAGEAIQTRADPQEVEFIVNAGFEGSSGLTSNQRSVGASMDTACASLENSENNLNTEQQDLLNTCRNLEDATPEDIAIAVARLTPEEGFAAGSATLDTSDIQVTNVSSRINAIRLGSTGLDLAALHVTLAGQEIPAYVMGAIGDELSGGGASGHDSGRLGVFINGSFSFGEIDETDAEMGLEFDSQGLTLGADYRTDDGWVYGGALGIVNHKGDYTQEGGDIDLKGTSISAYMTWYDEDKAYFDAIINFGQNDFDIRRRINAPGQPDQFAKGSPSATEFSISVGGGLEYYRGGTKFGPYGRLSLVQADVDAYDESASDPDAPGTGSVLSVGSQKLESTSLVAGGEVSRVINTNRGVWIPQLRLEWEHRLDDDNRTIEASFIHDPSAAEFEIESEAVDTDYLNLGTGVSAVFKNGKSAYIFYETRIGQDRVSQNWIKGGLRLEF